MPFETFKSIFNGNNVVEDRVSMAHGLESRVPFLDHPLVELAETIPSKIKFKNGTMKHILKKATRPCLSDIIFERKDKMRFPVPLNEWIKGELKDFVYDIFSSQKALQRDLGNNRKVLDAWDKKCSTRKDIRSF